MKGSQKTAMSDNPLPPDGSNEDWENRVLCPDEACIGVIGPDGRCKECGLVYEGELPTTRNASDESPNPAPTETTEADETPRPGHVADGEDDADADDDADGDEWQRRTLCSDESCIGVIGSDGRCKECGKPYRP